MSYATERQPEQERLVWMSCREVHPQSVTAPWSQLRISKGAPNPHSGQTDL